MPGDSASIPEPWQSGSEGSPATLPAHSGGLRALPRLARVDGRLNLAARSAASVSLTLARRAKTPTTDSSRASLRRVLAAAAAWTWVCWVWAVPIAIFALIHSTIIGASIHPGSKRLGPRPNLIEVLIRQQSESFLVQAQLLGVFFILNLLVYESRITSVFVTNETQHLMDSPTWVREPQCSAAQSPELRR